MNMEKFIAGYIKDHEGGLSMDPSDNGNWTGGARGSGKLVGSKYGTTAGALAVYRGMPASAITRTDIANLTLDEAVAVGMKLFYHTPGFDKLPVNRITLSIIDMAWGAGPDRAIKLMQQMIGTTADGQIGPYTVRAYKEWLAKRTEAQAAQDWADIRNGFYQRIASNEGRTIPTASTSRAG
jgi:lysozyme family protein